ncbi:hypothetical protein JYU04_01600 [Dehalococcoides mccartyi]|nr:hypothetical protein [Dehalococcoides mccartyi]
MSESDPPATQIPPTVGATAVSTAAPTSTLVPTAAPTSFLPDLALNDLSCVDFHSGIPVPDGPNSWFNLSGSLSNAGDSDLQLLGVIEIRNSEGQTLITNSNLVSLVEAGGTATFGHRVELSVQADDFTCRVTFTRSGDESIEHVTIADVESVFAP